MMKKKILMTAILGIYLSIGWYCVIGSDSQFESEQEKLLLEARNYLEDEIYIKAIPLYKEAINIKTKMTNEIVYELAQAYKQSGDLMSYRNQLDFLMSDEAPSEEVFIEAAMYDIENNRYNSGLSVLKDGIEKLNSEKLIQVYEDNRYEIKVLNGNYNDITLASNGLIAVSVNDMWGYVDYDGREVIPYIYDFATPFLEDETLAIDKSKGVIIDTSGNRLAITESDIEEVSSVVNSVYWLKKDNKWYSANNELELGTFTYDYRGVISEDCFVVIDNEKYGLVNTNNDFIIDLGASEIAIDEIGRALVNNRVFVKLNEDFQLMNGKGEVITEVAYEDAFPFYKNQELAAVKKDGKWGFVDVAGNEILPFKWEDAKSFSSNVAAVKENGKWGFINQAGEYIIQPQYSEVNSFIDGVGSIFEEGSWSIIKLLEYQ